MLSQFKKKRQIDGSYQWLQVLVLDSPSVSKPVLQLLLFLSRLTHMDTTNGTRTQNVQI